MPASTRQKVIFPVRTYRDKVLATRRENLIAYWPLSEPAGTNAIDVSGYGRNGTYVNIQLDQSGWGDGGAAPLYNGTDAHTDISALLPAFNGQTGTFHLAMRHPGAWADGSERYALYIAPNNAGDNFYFRKNSNGAMVASRSAGGASSIYIIAARDAAWFTFTMTWDQPANQLAGYVNGVYVGAGSAGSLAVWVGTQTWTTRCNIGSLATTSAAADRWQGNIAHVAIWNRALSASEAATLAINHG